MTASLRLHQLAPALHGFATVARRLRPQPRELPGTAPARTAMNLPEHLSRSEIRDVQVRELDFHARIC